MAEITVRGYVNKPTNRESAKGTFGTFTLAEAQKQKDGSKKKVFYDCVDFNGNAPPDSSFVTLTGWFSVKEYDKKDGTKGHGLNINVQKIEVSPPRGDAYEGNSAPVTGGKIPHDPFGL